ncbi:MAG: M48 family metallopeptidase [Magnetococcus sp. DMHC-1]|nr:M48 family metallopeptidase [Magnetococcales bacterium]
MNLHGWMILTALGVGLVIDLVAQGLNLRSLRQGIPEEFAKDIDGKQYLRHQTYIRAQTHLHMVQAVFDLAILAGFWFGHGFSWLDATVRTLQWSPLASGLFYIGTLLLASRFLSLPFTIYATFVLEARFGFNRTSIGTFILDSVKGLFLMLVLGGPLLAGILLLFERFGPGAWLAGWGVMAGFALLMQIIVPIWLMPLFNRFSPLPEGELKETLLTYTRSVGFPVADIVVMDGSRRSTKANAFFTGFGRFRRIVLFDTLIQGYTSSELKAILAHEVGHWRQRHLHESLLLGILNLGMMLYLLSLCLTVPDLYKAFHVTVPSVHAGLIFFALLMTPVELLLTPLLKWRSRQHEYAADRFAARTCGDGESLVDALKKLAKDHLSHMTPHPFYVFMNHSHPPLAERVGRIRMAMEEMIRADRHISGGDRDA